jgi:hypothetical protein
MLVLEHELERRRIGQPGAGRPGFAVAGSGDHLGEVATADPDRDAWLHGAGGDVTERGERMPVGGAGCVDDLGRHRDVLAAREVVVAEPLGLDGDAGDLLDARRLLSLGARPGEPRDRGRDDAELHGSAIAVLLAGE